ncbi:MAG: hypothetical protein EHM89_11905, partial [Acidobacteria bacterium]
MADETRDRQEERGLSRRELLKRAGMAGAVAAVPVDVLGRAVGSTALASLEAFTQATAAIKREPLETLTAAESDALEAIVA